ncbi:MAG: hypothetical protein LBM98_07485 [Oscillospiraceae bacterium]|nr:hypothetical protein [Oscillospiraceae bacterium]
MRPVIYNALAIVGDDAHIVPRVLKTCKQSAKSSKVRHCEAPISSTYNAV